MTRLPNRRAALQAGLLLCASIAAPQTSRACEFFAPNLRVYRPWTRATAPQDEVAMIYMTFDEVTRADRLIGVETAVAERAEMGGVGARSDVSFVIPEGRESVLSENGTHLRLVGLKHPLLLGSSYPLNLVFERGGLVIADFDVDFERIG